MLDLSVGLDLEDGQPFFGCGHEVHGDREPRPAQENVRETRVGELHDTCLCAEVEGDIAHVCLNLAQRERELMVRLVPAGKHWLARVQNDISRVNVLDVVVRAELGKVARVDGDKVREEVLA